MKTVYEPPKKPKYQMPWNWTVIPTLALTTGNPVYLISPKGTSECDRSAEDAYSSITPDPTFTFVEDPWCPTLEFVIAFWIMIYVSHIVNFAILY
jgi:hypothetical protein